MSTPLDKKNKFIRKEFFMSKITDDKYLEIIPLNIYICIFRR